MTKTMTIDNPAQMQEVFDSISDDFNRIDYKAELVNELDLIADLHKGYFAKSGGPAGAWKPNAPRTIKQKGHSIILRGVRGKTQKHIKATKRRPKVFSPFHSKIRGYRLATSLTTKTSQTYGDAIREVVSDSRGAALSFGTSVEYSIFNQEGTSRAPARPHVGLTTKFVDGMTNRIADHIVAELAK